MHMFINSVPSQVLRHLVCKYIWDGSSKNNTTQLNKMAILWTNKNHISTKYKEIRLAE